MKKKNLLALVLLAFASHSAAQFTFRHELAAGGMVRVLDRDYGLIGGGNGGQGTSVNFDDGNLNYGRGFTGLAVQGRSSVERISDATELRLEVVYFYDALNASGNADFRELSEEARDRVGRGIYLNDAYAGVRGHVHDSSIGARVGIQRLRWSESRYFGYGMVPVNPVAASRRYQPGNSASDAVVGLPMLTVHLENSARWMVSGFYQLGFKPTEPEAAGTFLSTNDYYSPGSRFLQLGQGSPLVPDDDASVTTPVTPFGSRVGRGPDRRPGADGQFGLRVQSPELGGRALVLSAYAMRVHTREPIVSVTSGTLDGLRGITAPDYTSSGNYFVEYPRGVTVVGGGARWKAATYTQLGVDYSLRRGQPLQGDDDILITAGLAPAAATVACAPNPTGPACVATLAALNRNPLIAAAGGITAANAATFFAREIPGYARFDVSQYAISIVQGLPPAFGATQWYVEGEAGGLSIHGFRDRFLDASVSVRPNDAGGRRLGFASRESWGYRVSTRMEFANVLGVRSVAPSIAWYQDVRGNAPITLGTFLEKNKSAVLALDLGMARALSARVSYRSYFGKGTDADRLTDRDFVAFSVTKAF